MNGPEHRHREERLDWEQDPVWKLVDSAKGPAPGPFFVRDVMRRVRLSEGTARPWWRRLLAPKPLVAGALAAAVVAFLLVLNDGGHRAGPDGLAETPEPTTEEPAAPTPLEQLLEAEMLFEAAEDPSAFTVEALVTMLY